MTDNKISIEKLEDIAMKDAYDFCSCRGHKSDWMKYHTKTERERRIRRIKLILNEVGIEVKRK